MIPARGQHKIEWLDFGREPQVKPDPKFPKGRDIALPIDPKMPRCRVELPYPAKRCGLYQIKCALCGFVLGILTAGRPDDPKSVEIPCKPVLN
jgi:hypothetical protein